ncbi:MAG: hypothetical protein ACI4X9_05215 [Kiritimatiellia bacterium]
MKKFLIAGCALVMAVSVQAASYAWSTVEAYFYTPNADGSPSSTKLTGAIAYLFEGTAEDMATTVAAINDGTFTGAGAIMSTTTNAKGKLSGTSDDIISGAGIYNVYMVIFDAATIGEAQFYQFASMTVDYGGTGNAQASFSGVGGTSNAWNPIATVPEPVFMGIFAAGMVAVLLRRQKNIA